MSETISKPLIVHGINFVHHNFVNELLGSANHKFRTVKLFSNHNQVTLTNNRKRLHLVTKPYYGFIQIMNICRHMIPLWTGNLWINSINIYFVRKIITPVSCIISNTNALVFEYYNVLKYRLHVRDLRAQEELMHCTVIQLQF